LRLSSSRFWFRARHVQVSLPRETHSLSVWTTRDLDQMAIFSRYSFLCCLTLADPAFLGFLSVVQHDEIHLQEFSSPNGCLTPEAFFRFFRFPLTRPAGRPGRLAFFPSVMRGTAPYQRFLLAMPTRRKPVFAKSPRHLPPYRVSSFFAPPRVFSARLMTCHR